MKNLCYTAPRHPGSDKPATENERPGKCIEADGIENEVLRTPTHDKRPSSRKSKRSVRESFSQSLRDLEDVDESEFYDHLLTLKNEHKRTLKAVEKIYYSELGKRRSGFELDTGTTIAVNDYVEKVPPEAEEIPLDSFGHSVDNFNPAVVDFRNYAKEHSRGDLPHRPKDHVRDMSIGNGETELNKENEGRFLTLYFYFPLFLYFKFKLLQIITLKYGIMVNTRNQSNYGPSLRMIYDI